ncbi:MAG: lysine--tRNA ligase [Acidobacteria bacterium]|nr:lysine--tRNA ligase [Acidobacteriota bacterium]
MTSRLPEEIVPDNDQTRARAEHLARIQELVGNAYPNKFERTALTENAEGEDTITSVVSAFRKYEPEIKEGEEKPAPEQLETANAELSGLKVRVSGRLATPPRVMGKAAFVHLSDGGERLQIYVRRQEAVAVSNDSLQPVEEAESGWKLFQLLDHGDFVGVEGRLFVTKTGELSVHVETIQFLSKALLPMPDKLHGINDPEIRQRQRYADLIASSLKVKTGEEPDGSQPELSTREVFERRSKLVTAMRRHLDEHGYIEVETPMLSAIASGAAAKPFVTHHNALDIDLYLRIAPELYLKRLLVGGFERVYELNRNFRNEGISTRHNPEFTMLEFYTAYKDVNWMMDFCEEMLRKSVETTAGTLKVRFKGNAGRTTFILDGRSVLEKEIVIDFEAPFRRMSMRQSIINELHPLAKERINEQHIEDWLGRGANAKKLSEFWWWLDEDLFNETMHYDEEEDKFVQIMSMEAVNTMVDSKWAEINSKYQDDDADEVEIANAILSLFDDFVENRLEQPTFITDFPKVISPLSKASPDNPAIAERFELFIAWMEVANGFSELNDPAEQLERFEEQARQREGGDEEAMQTDLDYVRALSYGMPPAAGIGIGIDRMTMLLTNRRSIRDVILFPHMRPRAAQADESDEQAGNP